MEESFRISSRNVSGLQPPVGGDCFSGCGLIVEISLRGGVKKCVSGTLLFKYLHHVGTTDPKFANRTFALRHIVSVIVYKPDLHVWNGTTGRTGIWESFCGGHPQNSGDFRHSVG